MRKKVKSFALEERPYENLYSIFKENYVEIGMSYCINKYLKEFLDYLQSIKKELDKNLTYTVPMAFIIETIAREPIFKVFDSEVSIKEELDNLQTRYNIHIKKYPEKMQEYDTEKLKTELRFTKVVQWILKAAWLEKKLGRELTDDEWLDLGREIGGNEFLKGLRTKLKPVTEKMEKYDPDIGDLWEKISNKLFKK